MPNLRFGSCRAGIIETYDEDEEKTYLVLHNIESTRRNQGDGSITLEMCKEFALESNMELRAHPWALEGDHARLKAWYIKHGFIDTGDWFVFNVIV